MSDLFGLLGVNGPMGARNIFGGSSDSNMIMRGDSGGITWSNPAYGSPQTLSQGLQVDDLMGKVQQMYSNPLLRLLHGWAAPLPGENPNTTLTRLLKENESTKDQQEMSDSGGVFGSLFNGKAPSLMNGALSQLGRRKLTDGSSGVNGSTNINGVGGNPSNLPIIDLPVSRG